MTRFTGSGQVLNWLPSTGGTTSLSSDFTKVTLTPSGQKVKVTAANELWDTYLATTKDYKLAYAGYLPVGGTALEDALLANTFGTLIYGPEGTATGKRKYTIPAFAEGANIDAPFDNAVTVTCNFQSSGTPTIAVY